MSANPIYEYSLDDLDVFCEKDTAYCAFWESKPELKIIVDDLLAKHSKDEVLQCLVDFSAPLLDFEKACDFIWWIHLYIYRVKRLRIFKDTLWIFNTPEHPFEKFLVKRLIERGIDPYEVYETTFPQIVCS